MPPKTASTTWPPRRTTRSTARKSVTAYSRGPTDSHSPSASRSSTAVTPSSSIAIPTLPEPFLETLPQNSPNIINAPNQTTPVPRTPFQNLEKTLSTNSVQVKCNNAEKVKSDPPEKETAHVETQILMQSGDDAKNELILPCLPQEKHETSILPAAGPESGVGEVAGAGKGTRKVIRRTVRVVKRVIKRRLPKKVLINASDDQGMMEIMENVVYPSGITHSDLVNDVIQNSDRVEKLTDSVVNEAEEISNVAAGDITESVPVNNEIKKPSIASKKAKRSNTHDELKEALRLDNGTCVSKAVVGEMGHGKSGIDSTEMGTSQISSEAGGSEPIIDDRGNDLSGIEFTETTTSEANVMSRGLGQLVGEETNDRTPLVTVDMESDDVMAEVGMEYINTDSVEDMKVQFAAKSRPESERTEGIIDTGIEDDQGDFGMGNQSVDVVGLIAAQLLGPIIPVEEKHVLVQDKDGSLVKPEIGTSQVDNHSVGINEGLLLSGEMEAVERRKRRKTEIFVGGLNKDAKEDDIRKVFEEAGTILNVRLVMKGNTGKNKGFAFVRFATAADANNALAKYSKVEICGKQCDATYVQGNDTIFLGNIDRNWKTEYLMQLLEKAGIENIDKVTIKVDPNNIERNRGFAFVEFETRWDAQIAIHKLENINVFGKHQKIKVAWAQPLIEPDEGDILKVKSVFAEYMPSSWNEAKVKEYFKRFGEIESVALAKDLPSSRRNDFAFINYTTREAALACIEAVRNERFEGCGSKGKMAVSLAKPISVKRQMKHASSPSMKQLAKETSKVSQATNKLHEPRNYGKSSSRSFNHAKVNCRSSTTDELVQLLRQQASSDHVSPRPSIGTMLPGDHFVLPGGKRPFPIVRHDPYLQPRGLPRARVESYNPVPGQSSSYHSGGMSSFPYHQQGHGFTSESVYGRNIYPDHFLTRDHAPPHYGDNSKYRRY